jgi:hypothetical protein
MRNVKRFYWDIWLRRHGAGQGDVDIIYTFPITIAIMKLSSHPDFI